MSGLALETILPADAIAANGEALAGAISRGWVCMDADGRLTPGPQAEEGLAAARDHLGERLGVLDRLCDFWQALSEEELDACIAVERVRRGGMGGTAADFGEAAHRLIPDVPAEAARRAARLMAAEGLLVTADEQGALAL